MELNFLRNILNDLKNRFNQRNLPHKHYLKRELINLNDFEKRLIRKEILALNWNIGSSEVIKLLSETDILNINDYLSANQTELIEIITDIFEDSDNNSILIEDILNGNKYNEQIDEYLKSYVSDVLLHSELIENEAITKLHRNLSQASFKNVILPKFINILIEHQYEGISSLIEIVSHQKEWNEKFKQLPILETILTNLVSIHSDIFIQEMIELIQSDKDFNWFFILMILTYVKEDCEHFNDLKKILDSQFKIYRTSNNLIGLYKSLILARQLYHYSSVKKSTTYKKWMKNNVGELNYTIKNKSMFSDLIESLENMVTYESDIEILNIHLTTQISAPSKEYNTVLEYKRLIQSKLDALN